MNFTEQMAKDLIAAKQSVGGKNFVNNGDEIVYGTGSAQKVYLRVIEFFTKNPKPKDWKPKALYDVVHQKHIIKENYKEVSNYWLSVMDQYISKGKATEATTQDRTQFWDQFSKHYNSHGKDPKSLTPGNRAKGPESSPQGQNAWVQAPDEALIKDVIVRRSCKFLLYESIANGKSVAYVLDDLDLNTVAQRQKFTEQVDRSGVIQDERKVPVCTSELRETFRRWDFFCKHLTFYERFLIADPPWFRTGQDHWSAYACHLAGKWQNQMPNHAPNGFAARLQNVLQHHQNHEYGNCINAFHALNPSRYLWKGYVNNASLEDY